MIVPGAVLIHPSASTWTLGVVSFFNAFNPHACTLSLDRYLCFQPWTWVLHDPTGLSRFGNMEGVEVEYPTDLDLANTAAAALLTASLMQDIDEGDEEEVTATEGGAGGEAAAEAGAEGGQQAGVGGGLQDIE